MPVSTPLVSMPTRILIGPSYARSSGCSSVVQNARPRSVWPFMALKWGGSPAFGVNAVAAGNSRFRFASIFGSMGACAVSTTTATAANASESEQRTARDYIATITGKLEVTMKLFIRGAVAAASLAVLPVVIQAHFRLLEPASWLIENDLGDPQKAGPCGGSNADWGKP